MSGKDCGHHHNKRKKLLGRFCGVLCVFAFIVLFVVLIIFLVLRPTRPHFTLQDVSVYQFNLTSPNYLTSTFQVTVASKNPNDKIGIYYDRLDVYAEYRNQQITLASSLQSTYQGHKDVNVWSPYVVGTAVPIAPFLAVALAQDTQVGMILVNIKLDGRVRWKVGTWISGKYHLIVNCPAYLTIGSKSNGGYVGGGAPVKYQLDRQCHTDV